MKKYTVEIFYGVLSVRKSIEAESSKDAISEALNSYKEDPLYPVYKVEVKERNF